MNDIQETCQKNAAAALAVGRRDVAKVGACILFIFNLHLNQILNAFVDATEVETIQNMEPGRF